MLLELHNFLPVITKKGKGRVLFLLDYGPDSSTLMFVVLNESGECWWVRQQDLRVEGNYTFGTSALPPA